MNLLVLDAVEPEHEVVLAQECALDQEGERTLKRTLVVVDRAVPVVGGEDAVDLCVDPEAPLGVVPVARARRPIS
jgi:hypothetical protein